MQASLAQRPHHIVVGIPLQVGRGVRGVRSLVAKRHQRGAEVAAGTKGGGGCGQGQFELRVDLVGKRGGAPFGVPHTMLGLWRATHGEP